MLMVPVSPGELIDKITILEIKLERIDDPGKRGHVKVEHAALVKVAAPFSAAPGLAALKGELRLVNERLWNIEDDIRGCERVKRFDERFIELARAVYHTNDQRAAIKRAINELLDSPLREEKSYAPY
jgi:hypothetical protein